MQSVFEKLREFDDLHNRLSDSSINRIIKKVKNIDLVRKGVAEDPKMFIGKRSQKV